MRIALISDIHANLDALTAILEDIRKKAPDIVISLGDQIGMGPEPTQVLDVFMANHIPCLLGNHEVRVLSYWEDADPALREDINYAFVRWGAERVQSYDIRFPLEKTLETPIGKLFMTHAGVGDPFARIMPRASGEQRAVLEGLCQVAAAMVAAGHSHYAYQLFTKNRPIVIVGSIGLAHNHIPGTGGVYAIGNRRNWRTSLSAGRKIR